MKKAELDLIRKWINAEINLTLAKSYYLGKGGLRAVESEKTIADKLYVEVAKLLCKGETD